MSLNNPFNVSSAASPYNEENPYWIVAQGNPYDIAHPKYPYDLTKRPVSWSLFPAGLNHLYHPDNVRNPYHPNNANCVILRGGIVENPDNAYHPESIRNPFHPDHPNEPSLPPILKPPVAKCDVNFALTARSAPRPFNAIAERTSDVSFQVMHGLLSAPFENGVFTFRQQFLEHVSDIFKGDFKDKQTYCENPHIPENEKLTLTVDNSSDIFVLPTGGLGSSGAPCLFDWDVWVDYNYAGRYTGNSGIRSQGIELSLKPEAYRLAASIKVSLFLRVWEKPEPEEPDECDIFWQLSDEDDVDDHSVIWQLSDNIDDTGDCLIYWDIGDRIIARRSSSTEGVTNRSLSKYARISREKESIISMKVESDGQWECVPFWAKFTDSGILLSKNTGVYDNFLELDGLMRFNGGNTVLTVTRRRGAELHDRLLQGFIFYLKRKVNGCAVELVLLDFCRPDQNLEPLDINKQTIDIQYECIEPKFTIGSSQVQVHIDSSLTEQAVCVLNAIIEEFIRPVMPEPQMLPVSIGIRADVKDAEPMCSNFFTLAAGQVRLADRQSVFTDLARDKLKCFPYEPEGTSRIIIRPHYRTARFYGWLRAFGFHPRSVEAWNTQENKDKLLEAAMTITPPMFCDHDTNAGNYCMRYLFYGCRNLKLGSPFTFTGDWQTVARAGNDFMFKAFQGCESLDQFPIDYQEPQHFVMVGENFKAYKCYGCKSLQNIGAINTESPNLSSASYGFEAFEYYGCERLLVLPEKYNEVARIVSNKLYDFQMFKFARCSSLRTLPDRYTETEVVAVGDNYTSYKFSESGLEFLPKQYAESLPLTFIGKNCQVGKFAGCARLAGLPVHYTEISPANVDINFIKWKFKDCPLLVVNPVYKFPNVGEAVNKRGVFEETFASAGSILQNVTAEEIINGNITPAVPKRTFGMGFSDYDQLDENWKL